MHKLFNIVHDYEYGGDDEAIGSWLHRGRTIFSVTRTIAMPFPTPLVLWCSPFNITVYPCLDGDLIVVAYALNQKAERIGPYLRRHKSEHEQYDIDTDQYVHVSIRVFPRSVSWEGGRDEAKKYPPFYEVSVTCMHIVRLLAVISTTPNVVGEWMAAFARGKRQWRGLNNREYNPAVEQVYVLNDVYAKRRACVVSTKDGDRKFQWKRECWLASIGSDKQGNRPSTLDVSVHREQLQYARCLSAAKNKVGALITHYAHPEKGWRLPS